MRRVISRPPTRSATSALPPRPPLAALAALAATLLARSPRLAPPRRQPIVSAAIVIYRPDDLRFRLHQPRYQTVPGRPEVSSDSSARDRSYILADDSAAPLVLAHRVPPFTGPRISGCVRSASASRTLPPVLEQPREDTALRAPFAFFFPCSSHRGPLRRSHRGSGNTWPGKTESRWND